MVVSVKASKLKIGDMVEVDVGENFDSRDFVQIVDIYPVGESRWHGLVDVVLNEIDDLGEQRIEAFKANEMMKVRKPLSAMTKAEHEKVIKKLSSDLDRITAALSDHEKALLSLKVAKSRTKSHVVKKAYKVKVGDKIDSEEFPTGFKKVVEISHGDEMLFYFSDGDELQVGERSPVLVKTKKVSK